jgi:hypothetical protein
MKATILKYTDKLRQKTSYQFINNDISLVGNNESPFNKGEIPVMLNFLQNKPPSFNAYESGNRSILIPHCDGFIKAKGIGISKGVSQPIYEKDTIKTYQLYDDPNMCHKLIIWGFMHEKEYECEIFGAKKAKELGQKLELLGITKFDNIHCIKFKDRIELFNTLYDKDSGLIFSNLKHKIFKTTGYSVYYKIYSDIRVQEILYTYMFPQITKIMDPNILIDYARWLGSSCGYLLRQFHDANTLHGTWVGDRATSLGLKDIHSNSYVGNYTIDEENITMCDFDLSKPIQKESEKDIEKWALIHIENPLHYAGSYWQNDAIKYSIAKRNPFREKIAKHFKEAIDLGYNGDQFIIENKLKKLVLNNLIEVKKILWELYNFPEDFVGHIAYIDQKITELKVDNKKLLNLYNKENV